MRNGWDGAIPAKNMKIELATNKFKKKGFRIHSRIETKQDRRKYKQGQRKENVRMDWMPPFHPFFLLVKFSYINHLSNVKPTHREQKCIYEPIHPRSNGILFVPYIIVKRNGRNAEKQNQTKEIQSRRRFVLDWHNRKKKHQSERNVGKKTRNGIYSIEVQYRIHP